MNVSESTPLVAIKCLVYNHEPYLRQCLDGFVMQKTDFPFVAIVHDDASTDRSAAIIREYAEKYPEIIKPIYETENQYSKRDDSLSKIMDEAIDATGTKYIALCEGDDYWTCPEKLQRQVDILENNNDIVLCYHPICIEINNNISLVDLENVPEVTQTRDLAKGNYIATLSVMYRNIITNTDIKWCRGMPLGDYPLWLTISQYGGMFKMLDAMGVYRYGNGVWSSLSSLEQSKLMIRIIPLCIRHFITKQDVVDAFIQQMSNIFNDVCDYAVYLENEVSRIPPPVKPSGIVNDFKKKCRHFIKQRFPYVRNFKKSFSFRHSSML